MKSKDYIKAELLSKLGDALKDGAPDALAEALTDYAMGVQESVLADCNQFAQTKDAQILSGRGIRQLTTKETKFYEAAAQAVHTGDIKAAFEGLEPALPETVLEAVVGDIKSAHPLLEKIKFQYTGALTKIIVNAQGAQLAVWGPLGSKITQELGGALKTIHLTKAKLSAFLPVAKDMLEAGPQWMDAYVREVLAEALALALETAIITGTGKDMPIGMDRNVADNVTVTGGVYPKKTAQKITDLSPATVGGIAARLATKPTGGYRPVPVITLLVNPVDYFTKIMPATTVRAADGSYANNIFPYPTEVIQSAAVERGSAIAGLSELYFLGLGTSGTGGLIDFSDEVRFLEDERVYITKLHGDGRAMDDNAFVLLDISKLEPAVFTVSVQGTVETKAAP